MSTNGKAHWQLVLVALVVCVCFLDLLYLPQAKGADTDVGNIAVIEADPTILQPGELFDLSDHTLTFTPKSGGGYTVTIGNLNFDSRLGNNLNLGDDNSVFGGLGFTFPFFGVNFTTAFVNSNGYLTFGSESSFVHFNEQSGGNVSGLGDASTVLNRISEEFRRIAVLWQDWNPSAGGGVFANALADRLIVTWNAVPLFGTSTTATFQAILFSSGVIQMNYQSVTTTPGGGYLVGISPGSVFQYLVTTIDFSEGVGSSISPFPIFEPLVQVFGSTSSPLVHISAVARRFFNTHGDDFDQLVMFANFTHAEGGFFHLRTRQTVSGIGLGPFNISSFFGSAGQLQGFINMNRLECFPSNPNQTVTSGPCGTLFTNSTLDLLGQESGHMWLAFPEFDDTGVNSDLLLGRDLSHWSFFHDTDASDMEGNKWQDNSNGTFTTTEATVRFSPLDQYLMGIRTASEVPDFFFIRNPSLEICFTLFEFCNRSSPPEIGVTVSGTRQNVTINQIIAVSSQGARSPSSGFTAVNPTTTWNQAFVLLIPEGTTAPSADVTKIDTIRSAWVPYFNAATDNRGTIDTTIPTFGGGKDLVIEGLGLSSSSVAPGGSTTVSYDIANRGTTTVTESYTEKIYLSTNNTLDGSDVLLGTSHLHTVDLAPGGIHSDSSTSQTVTIPTGTTPGSYFILVEADTLATVTESDESNNVTATPLTVSGALLTIIKTGSGSGTVTSSPAGINCGSDCSEFFNQGTIVTLTATPAADSLFSGFSGGGCSGTGVCMLTVNANTSITATFNKIPRTLTVSKAGVGSGTVTSNPAGINCGATCQASFSSSTSVTLTAAADQGSTFAGFSGGGCSGTGPCTVIVNANTTITTTFDSPGTSTFTDDPLTAGTTIKAVHPNELRQAVDNLRAQGGLGAFLYTDPNLTAGVDVVKAIDFNEIITALTEAATALGQAAPNLTPVAPGDTVRAADIQAIRNAIRAVES